MFTSMLDREGARLGLLKGFSFLSTVQAASELKLCCSGSRSEGVCQAGQNFLSVRSVCKGLSCPSQGRRRAQGHEEPVAGT